jgi:hypothetical protein
MIPGINLKVIREPDDDGLYQYEVTLSNGKTFGSLMFYEYADCFKQFGQSLTQFPKTSKDVVTYQLLEEDKKYAYYMLLRVFCYEQNGQSAIRVITDNHSAEPDYQRCEFFIRSTPASINRLGQGLENWDPKETKDFSWNADS